MTNEEPHILTVRTSDLRIVNWKQEGMSRARCEKCNRKCWLSPGAKAAKERLGLKVMCINCRGLDPKFILNGWANLPPEMRKDWDDYTLGGKGVG